ncbi:hypothetical protein PUN28_015688 [Cardiocondyla obscurior]|uniref:Uncharacterized protein n=1 Tax=Cardiocondyla obscurior TaxID=286306 RepID=A0AAW2EYN1_9HYME
MIVLLENVLIFDLAFQTIELILIPSHYLTQQNIFLTRNSLPHRSNGNKINMFDSAIHFLSVSPSCGLWQRGRTPGLRRNEAAQDARFALQRAAPVHQSRIN